MLALTWLWSCTSSTTPTRPDPLPDDTTTEPPELGDVEVAIAEQPVEPPAGVCDAGEEAWVARTLPLVWGRRPKGSEELRTWADVARRIGRADTVRAMTRSPEYVDAWTTWLADELFVARSGDKDFKRCFEDPMLEVHDGRLTAHLRDRPPLEVFGEPFQMSDVFRDALVADDLSVVYRSWLFARMAQPTVGANVSAEELEYNARVDFGETFLQTYLGRDVTCLACHNSEFSVTDNPDPRYDRTWQLPGLVEQAVFGASTGPSDEDVVYAMFMRDGVSKFRRGLEPWGMDRWCGEFVDPADISSGPDWIGQDERFFVVPYGSDGSVWDVEDHLRLGVERLRGVGLRPEADGTVDGDAAFAWMVATTLADDVWAAASGHHLVVAHGFPRNQGQQQILSELATSFAVGGFSLRELLVTAATRPEFNPGLSCGADPYGMDAVFDPFTDAEALHGRKGNGPGDAVHAHTARTLMRSLHTDLLWAPPPEWDLSREDEEFQAAVGVFLRQSTPGFTGSDFQSFLEFEARYGACTNPDPRGGPDLLDLLSASAAEDGRTAGEVVATVRDRLVSDGALDPTEQALVETLIGAPLSARVSDVTDFREGLGAYCGALILSPLFWLVHEAVPGEPPPIAIGREQDCAAAAGLLSSQGYAVSCEGTDLSWE